MNMQTPRSVRNQAGFTLIELIVVIVILGILAATALPKFADLGGDARYASLKAAEGSIRSVVSMAHARALVTNTPDATVTFEGQDIAMSNGYPKTDNIAAAAGLSANDYTITPGSPLVITPKSVSSANAATCRIEYTAASGVNSPPTITFKPTGPAQC